jgi:hypothetical protein
MRIYLLAGSVVLNERYRLVLCNRDATCLSDAGSVLVYYLGELML